MAHGDRQKRGDMARIGWSEGEAAPQAVGGVAMLGARATQGYRATGLHRATQGYTGLHSRATELHSRTTQGYTGPRVTQGYTAELYSRATQQGYRASLQGYTGLQGYTVQQAAVADFSLQAPKPKQNRRGSRSAGGGWCCKARRQHYQARRQGYQGLSRGTKGYQGLPRGIKGYQGVPRAIKGYQARRRLRGAKATFDCRLLVACTQT